MCGILGTVSVRGDLRAEEHEAGLATLTHRGPDGQATWHDEHCFLGHRRVAIIDLSENAEERADVFAQGTRLISTHTYEEVEGWFRPAGLASLRRGGPSTSWVGARDEGAFLR